MLESMTRRPNQTAKDWYLRVVQDRDAAAAKLESVTVPTEKVRSAESSPNNPGTPQQEAAMRRLEELRLEAIEAEAAMINEGDPVDQQAPVSEQRR
jgi:hypothetical protein